MTLTDFLLARIAEDEAGAKRIHAERCATPHVTILDTMGRPMTPVCDCDWHVARVLAECEAKRQIVELSWHHLGDDDYGWGMEEAKRQILALLSLPYADHADYRDEWRP